MRIHVVGLVHTETTREFEVCAYTARTRVFAQMMHDRGHEVYLYAGEHNDARVTEHVPVTNRDEQAEWFPGYSTKKVFNQFDAESAPWKAFNMRAAVAIRERAHKGDILAVTMGLSHWPIATELNDMELMVTEIGIGYTGVFAPYRVFESHAWQHYMAAREKTDDVRSFDAVIPRAWDAREFPAGDGSGAYHLYVGRLTSRKGPHIAAEACKRLGVPLIFAGQGVKSARKGVITTDEGLKLRGDVRYAGIVDPVIRAELMGAAQAVWTPTQYLEPGGGVAIEAQLAGTPVISSDWGCFTETVEHGVTGYRCSVLSEYMTAAQSIDQLSRAAIRRKARARWSVEAVGPQFDRYFEKLQTLWGAGWYSV